MPARLQLADQRRHLCNLAAPLGQYEQAQSAEDLEPQSARIDHGSTIIEQQAGIYFQRTRNRARLTRIEAPARPFEPIGTGFEPSVAHCLLDALRINETWARGALGQHRGRYLDFGEQGRQQVQGIQSPESDQRPGIGDDDPGASL